MLIFSVFCVTIWIVHSDDPFELLFSQTQFYYRIIAVDTFLLFHLHFTTRETVKSEEPTEIDVYIETSAEMDEMWSFCHDKSQQIWLWWAVDHKTNTPLAYTFGTREYKYLDELLELLSEFNIGTVYADNNFAYSSRISSDRLVTGKRNTQQIERDHLTLRTRIKRLARKTICFSKSLEIHKAVIGTFINIYFFGRTFDKSLLL